VKQIWIQGKHEANLTNMINAFTHTSYLVAASVDD